MWHRVKCHFIKSDTVHLSHRLEVNLCATAPLWGLFTLLYIYQEVDLHKTVQEVHAFEYCSPLNRTAKIICTNHCQLIFTNHYSNIFPFHGCYSLHVDTHRMSH